MLVGRLGADPAQIKMEGKGIATGKSGYFDILSFFYEFDLACKLLFTLFIASFILNKQNKYLCCLFYNIYIYVYCCYLHKYL